MTTDPLHPTPATPHRPREDSCPRCAPLPGGPDPARFEGAACPSCGRALPLPAGLPSGSVLTQLFALRLLGQPLPEAWRIIRDAVEDERLRTKLLTPVDPAVPDAYLSLGRAEVPDPLTPAVTALAREERALDTSGIRRLLYGTRFRHAMLTVILRETFGAGFQRDEARVAARLGFPVQWVHLAVNGKTLIRQ